MGEKEDDHRSIRIRETSSSHDEVEVSARHYFSHTHIRAAVLNARQAAKLEKKYVNSGTGTGKTADYRLEYQSYVCSSIISSALFLETTVHEFLSDINHKYAASERYNLASELVYAVKTTDEKARRRFTHESTLDKYQWLLSFAHEEPFITHQNPYQNMRDIVDIRNTLVHHEPKDILTSSTEQDVRIKHDLVEKLQNKPISRNPFIDGKSVQMYLSQDCASWTINSVLEFTDEFFSKIDETPPYDHIRSGITTKI